MNTRQPLPQSSEPFTCSYSGQIPELLSALNCTLAISTYQAGKLILLSPGNDGRLVQLPRTFPKPMGIALDESGNKMALACRDEVVVFSNAPQLGLHYPQKPGVYDAFYLPRLTYHTGPLDIHDLTWGDRGLYAVNTLFSCLVTFDDTHNFTPCWKPSFITALRPEDRCHLNGMALVNGKPGYVTAFGKWDEPQGWKKTVGKGGLLIDCASGEIVLENLPMPHSPRIINGQLFLLFSATGELAVVQPKQRTCDVVARIGGFVRGMDHCGDYLFICTSKQRTQSSSAGKLHLGDRENTAGVTVLHLPSGTIAGQIRYESSVEEIYDLRVLPGKRRPNILSSTRPEHSRAISLPGDSYWAMDQEPKLT